MTVIRFVKKGLTHRYLAFVFRLYIAGIFIYASMYKINYTAEFAETIASYQIVPYWGVSILAVVLPWIELICGILLFAGIRVRSAIAILSFLLLAFTIGIYINLISGSPISCGCFHTIGESISWRTVARDLIWLGMSIHIFFFDRIFQLGQRFSFTLKEI